MAKIVLYHHIQGLTDGVAGFAEELRSSGHTVHVLDMFEGQTFGSIEEGIAYARDAGFAPSAELFVYPGDQHLFTDSSLDSFDVDATVLLPERARGLLAAM